MGGKPLHTFYTQLVLVPQILHYAQYVLLGLGGLLLLVPIIYQLRSQVSRRGGPAQDSVLRFVSHSWLSFWCLSSHLALILLCQSWKAPDPPRWVLVSHLTSKWVPLDAGSGKCLLGGAGGRRGRGLWSVKARLNQTEKIMRET